jgi:hypothetical protein
LPGRFGGVALLDCSHLMLRSWNVLPYRRSRSRVHRRIGRTPLRLKARVLPEKFSSSALFHTASTAGRGNVTALS